MIGAAERRVSGGGGAVSIVSPSASPVGRALPADDPLTMGPGAQGHASTVPDGRLTMLTVLTVASPPLVAVLPIVP